MIISWGSSPGNPFWKSWATGSPPLWRDRRRFDLVITDYKMPKMNGLELIQRIRGLAAGAPIILVSGYAEALGMTEANTGADAVISKNANEVTHLVRSVNRLLRRATPKKPPAAQRRPARVKRQGA